MNSSKLKKAALGLVNHLKMSFPVLVGVLLLIGLLVGSRGIGGLIGFFLAMYTDRIDARVSMASGFLLLTMVVWLGSDNWDWAVKYPKAWIWPLKKDVTLFMKWLINDAIFGASATIVRSTLPMI